MPPFDDDIRRELDFLRESGLLRVLRRVESSPGPIIQCNGKSLLNFSSNDYLGLANHPALREAAARAAADWGAGSGASRLVCGSLPPHHHLEDALALFKGTEASLAFSTGYAAAVGIITAVVGKDDIIIVDKLAHASCIDGARLSGAKLRVFRHNDLDQLEDRLRWANTQRTVQKARRILVITESVFSMDGDLAPLRNVVELKERYGAWLMVDEAHATGLYGARRCGLVEEFQLTGQIEIQFGTLGKALGAAGGFVAGSRPLIDLVINRARSFIFSTAPVPAQCAAASAALALVRSEEGEVLRQRCWANVDATKCAIVEAGWKLPPAQSPILPLLLGDEQLALKSSAGLVEHGVFVPAIRYPTVARGAARLRLTVTAAHSPENIKMLAGALTATAPQQCPA
jgi:8-amino-7-oxononanoate synthase